MTAPTERVHWDQHVVSLLDGSNDSKIPNGHPEVRWRYRLGNVRVTLRDRPVEISRAQRLRSEIDLGLLRFEQTWTLADDSPLRTRLGLRVSSRNRIPVVGGEIDRFDVRRMASGFVASQLDGLRAWCERDPVENAPTSDVEVLADP